VFLRIEIENCKETVVVEYEMAVVEIYNRLENAQARLR
jgi:hypothetical protein